MPPRTLAIVLLAACGPSSSAVDPAQPAADPAPCADVATHEVKLMSVAFMGEQKTAALTTRLAGHCRDDSWSLEARKCLLTAVSFDGMGACDAKLTPAQRAGASRELQGSDGAVPAGTLGSSWAPNELLE